MTNFSYSTPNKSRLNTCLNCKFWTGTSAYDVVTGKVKTTDGECRGATPTFDKMAGRRFPITLATDWCRIHEQHNPHIEDMFGALISPPINDEDDSELGA